MGPLDLGIRMSGLFGRPKVSFPRPGTPIRALLGSGVPKEHLSWCICLWWRAAESFSSSLLLPMYHTHPRWEHREGQIPS